MDSIANIMPKAMRRGAIGRIIREQEELAAFNWALDQLLPGDLRSYVRGLYVQGSVLTAASLSGSATLILKKETEKLISLMKKFEPASRVQKLKVLS